MPALRQKWKRKRRFLQPLTDARVLSEQTKASVARARQSIELLPEMLAQAQAAGIPLTHDMVETMQKAFRRPTMVLEINYHGPDGTLHTFNGNMQEFNAHLLELAREKRSHGKIGKLRRILAGPRVNYRLIRRKTATKHQKK